MHTTPPRAPPALSPPSSSRWKRGRPVTSRPGYVEQHRRASNDCALALPSQCVQTKTALETTRRTSLWDPSQGLRFAPIVAAEACHPTSKAIGLNTEHRLGADQADQAIAYCIAEAALASSDYDKADGHPLHLDGSASPVLEGTERADDTPSTTSRPDETASINDNNLQPAEEEVEEEEKEEEEEEDYPPQKEPLAYQIPEDRLRTAMCASPNTRASYWNTKLYRGPKGEPLFIHYCKSFEVAERVAQHFMKEEVLGFDIEWKPWGRATSIKENVSLIQLACENRVALFHIALFPGETAEQLLPPTLKAILESPDIYKVGVAVKGDFSRLEKYLAVQAQGVFELSRLHNLVEWADVNTSKVSRKLVGLATQVLQHLQLPLYKGELLVDDPENTTSVRVSDWSLVLDLQQIHYAADDAYAGFRLYDTLERKRTQLKPVPPAIELCDYDSKRIPKPKVTRKRPTAAKKATDTNGAPVKPTVEKPDDEDNEGYETAPEEFLNSYDLEEPTTVRLQDDSKPILFTHQRMGQDDVPNQGPDPRYPILPQESAELTQGQPSPQVPDQSYIFPVEDDEFADAELEEALRTIDLDSDGSLRTSVHSVIKEVKTQCEDREPKSLSSITPPKESGVPSDQVVNTAEYNTGTVWATDYLQATVPSPNSVTRSRIHATIPYLRAYHLWHHQKLPLLQIAGHLRDPPLSVSTVTSYIVQAISLEKLEYEKEPLKEVMLAMPPGLRRGPCKWLAERVGA